MGLCFLLITFSYQCQCIIIVYYLRKFLLTYHNECSSLALLFQELQILLLFVCLIKHSVFSYHTELNFLIIYDIHLKLLCLLFSLLYLHISNSGAFAFSYIFNLFTKITINHNFNNLTLILSLFIEHSVIFSLFREI